MKKISSGNQAILSLKKGIDAVADIVKQTLGPNGSNVVLTRALLPPYITNDGVSIAKEIFLEDEIQNAGTQIIKDVAEKANDLAGDGTTTAIVLAQAIFNEIYDSHLNPELWSKDSVSKMGLRKKLQLACEEIIIELKKDAKQITTLEEIERVAFISMEDKEIAQKIASLVYKLGVAGTITVEEGDGFSVETEVIDGLEFPQGLFSPYMETNTTTHEAIVEDVPVLVTNRKISSVQQILPILEHLTKQNLRKLIIVGDFDSAVINNFLMNRLNNFIITAIKNPINETLKDICALTGAKFYDRDITDEFSPEGLGGADKITATQGKTIIIGGKGNVEARVQDLQEQIKKSNSSFDKKNLEERIGKLTTGVGVIRVGAVSETDRKYLKLKIDDAVAATKAALEEGVVAGGGLALKRVSERVNNILSKPILVPYTLIQESGVTDIPDGVIDPLKVTRTALESAVSVVSLLITSSAVIADKNEDKNKSEN